MAKELGIAQSIQTAPPTDGLFGDDRTDEDQIGASYPELEWAMKYVNNKEEKQLSEREQKVLSIYLARHNANKHKMEPIPVCSIPNDIKN